MPSTSRLSSPSPQLSTLVACYLAMIGLSVLPFWSTLSTLAVLVTQDGRYTYIIVIPFLSAAFIWLRRSSIFSNSHLASRLGVPLLVAGAVLQYRAAAHQPDFLWLAVAFIVLTWTAGFLLCFGPASLRAAVFPLLLLWFFIPPPDFCMKFIEIGLQKASADTAHVIFRLTGMPVFRQGMIFSLPGVDVMVAEECSGIRSSISLVIMVLVASQLLLKSTWRQLCLVLLAVPIVIFKNAVRITTLSWLGVYVSPSFFFGDLHHYGGMPFSLLAFALLIPIVMGLQSSERRSAAKLPATK